MNDHKFRLAQARDEWMESPDGLRCQEVGILLRPSNHQYLKNRLETAFIAGAIWMAGALRDIELNQSRSQNP